MNKYYCFYTANKKCRRMFVQSIHWNQIKYFISMYNMYNITQMYSQYVTY